jgi:triosephosphate isomerase
MSRNKIVAGNWKMNLQKWEALALLSQIKEASIDTNVTVIVHPSFVNLSIVKESATDSIKVGAQNVHHLEAGAYTGEVSASMLKSIDISYCIIGHSERRSYMMETNESISLKINQLLSHQITPIFCCGESLTIRENNQQTNFVEQQIKESLFHLTAEEMGKMVIAYEPIWAIGTGKTASIQQVQEMHQHIRSVIYNKYGSVADRVSILYGGSCKPDNAKELFALQDVDGGLIGGASLIAADFVKIINSF